MEATLFTQWSYDHLVSGGAMVGCAQLQPLEGDVNLLGGRWSE